jgi:hypothetical protein
MWLIPPVEEDDGRGICVSGRLEYAAAVDQQKLNEVQE